MILRGWNQLTVLDMAVIELNRLHDSCGLDKSAHKAPSLGRSFGG